MDNSTFDRQAPDNDLHTVYNTSYLGFQVSFKDTSDDVWMKNIYDLSRVNLFTSPVKYLLKMEQ